MLTLVLLLSLQTPQEPLRVAPKSVLGFIYSTAVLDAPGMKLQRCAGVNPGSADCSLLVAGSSGWIATPIVKCTTEACNKIPKGVGEAIYELPPVPDNTPRETPILTQLRVCDANDLCSQRYTRTIVVGALPPPDINELLLLR